MSTRKLIRFLVSSEASRLQLLSLLYLSRIYSATRKHCETMYTKLKRQTDMKQNNNCNEYQFDGWQWKGFPSIKRIFKNYELFTTSYMVYVVIKYTCPSIISKPIEVAGITELPDRCYLLGRFVIHPRFANELAAVLFSLFHLLWRAGQEKILYRPYFFSAMYFMMQTDKDLERFYAKLADLTDENTCDIYCANESSNVFDVSQIKHNGHSRIRKENQSKLLMNNFNSQVTKENNIYGLGYESLDLHGRFLIKHMCYKLINGDGIDYRLKPNRTRASRLRLAKLLANTVIFGVILFSILVVIFSTIVIYIILMDERFEREYLGCYSDSSRVIYRWFVTIFEMIENSIIWYESGMSLINVTLLNNFLSRDLLWYYQSLDEKINKLALSVRDRHYVMWERLSNYCRNDESDDDYNDEQQAPNNSPAEVNDESSAVYGELDENDQRSTNNNDNYLVNDLQAEILDFFHEIRRADLSVSDGITWGFLIWVITFAAFGYVSLDYYTSTRKTDLPIFLLVVQSIIFVTFVGSSASFMILSIRCRKSYVTICSLVAYDHSIYKDNSIRILDLYTQGTRFSFTLFQQYPFSPASILTLIGTSVTCFLLFDNVFMGSLKL